MGEIYEKEIINNPKTGNYVSYVLGLVIIAISGTSLTMLKKKKILNK